MSRNSLQMWNGFSSHQLVFGENPNLPNIMIDNLPSLEGKTSSEIFAQHLNALHAARKAFIQTEADERIRRALRNKVRASEQVFENGDIVFYKREGKERWLGPGKVVFQDGKVVFVRHGSVFVRVSPNRLQKVTKGLSIEDGTTTAESQEEKAEIKGKEDEPSEHTICEEIPATDEDKESNLSKAVQETRQIRANDKIQYKLQNGENWIRATVLGRAGKATGRNKNWYNILEDVSQERKSINLDQVGWEVITHDVNASVALKQTWESNDISTAKMAELQKLCHFHTYDEVRDCGQQSLSTRWVITNKEGQTKARLVVRGFEEDFIMPRDSPTVGKGTMRIFLALSSINNWNVKTTDIKSAFLQGQELMREVYVKPPKESSTSKGMIWKLKHGLYGLKDGARQFYLSVKEELLRLGCKMCETDPAMFFLHKEGKLSGIICCHVDDFLHAGDRYLENTMERLRKRFVAGNVQERNFNYIGFRITQKTNSIGLDQSTSVEDIQNKVIDLKKEQDRQSVLTTEEQTEFRKFVGQFNWVVQGTRPDMAIELLDFSTKFKEANISDLSRVIKTVKRLQDNRSMIQFPDWSKSMNDWKIIVFTDASLCNLNNRTGSTAGHIVWLTDNKGKCSPLYWHAGKIRRVVRSTIAAEALSLQEGIESAFYYRHIIQDITGIPPKSIPIIAYVDNKSVIEAIQSTKLVDDKRLRVDIAAISEVLTRQEVHEVKWCPGKMHLADCMTKRGAAGYELLTVLQNGRMPENFM